MPSTGLINAFTGGEISDDAWDRTDLQPVQKGAELAQNFVLRIAGPLGKRRGFWKLGTVQNQAVMGRLMAFRKTLNDALMLEFGDFIVRVWNSDGSPLLEGDIPFSFASPYSWRTAQLLRFKQVGDVIYIHTSDGQPPQTLQRDSNTSWAFNVITYPNGPWLNENLDLTSTITVTGTSEADQNTATGGGSILVGEAITLDASDDIFDPGQVGSCFRLRQNAGSSNCYSWTPGTGYFVGDYAISVGHVYKCTVSGAPGGTSVSNPPVQLSGSQSDGANMWLYRHDGAGVVLVTGYNGPTEVTGTVLATVPLKNGQSTSYWSEGAYSDFRGWPRAWPTIREERLVSGATTGNLDFIDTTETAGFYPTSENFHPGTGTGQVEDIDAIRRRLGDDGGEILWTDVATYLVAGTTSGEYLVAGSVLDEPLAPGTVTLKQLSSFGSADVQPQRCWKGLIYVTRGGQTCRELAIDTQQGSSTDDLTVLAQHIAVRGFARLAWLPQPDEVLYTQLGDGGLAAFTYHQEQQVRGWTSQQLGGGFIVEDQQVLPGPGGFETLWLIVSRQKNGVTQRAIWMQSRVSDQLFFDGAQLYEGGAQTELGGLADYVGESIAIIADSSQAPDTVVAADGTVAVAVASTAWAGFSYEAKFISLDLTPQAFGITLNKRQRIAKVVVSLKTAMAMVGLKGGALMERVSPRTAAQVPASISQRIVKPVTLAGDAQRDPRVVVTDSTGFDCVIYSIETSEVIGDS